MLGQRYICGAGWRGYDPTNGIAVADRHVTLVATALPQPRCSGFREIHGGVCSQGCNTINSTALTSVSGDVCLVPLDNVANQY